MNLPNLLTLLRIFFVPLLVAALLAEDLGRDWERWTDIPREMFALSVFLIAAATDLLDGYLARRWSQVTTVGTLLDPVADKMLITAALVSLVAIHRVSAWIVILILGREFAVSGLRQIAAASGYAIGASDLGKTKMAAQVIAISFVIAGTRWPQFERFGFIAMWAVVAFGLASAVDYFYKFWRTLDVEIKTRRRRELLELERQKRKARRAVLRAERRGGLANQASAGASATGRNPGAR